MNVMKHKVYMNYIHPSCMLQHLADLWRNGTLCDAILTVDNMVVGKAHKPVLFAASPKIQTMYTNPSQNFNSDIKLPKGVSTQSVTACLQYLYEGYLAITEHNVNDLKQIAEYLEIDSINKCCEDFINKVIPDRCDEAAADIRISESNQHFYKTTDTVQIFDKKSVTTKRYQRPDETEAHSAPDMPKRSKCNENIQYSISPVRESLSYSDRHMPSSSLATTVRSTENVFKSKTHQSSSAAHCFNEDSYSSNKSDLSQENQSNAPFIVSHSDSNMPGDSPGSMECMPGTSSSNQELVPIQYSELYGTPTYSYNMGLYHHSGGAGRRRSNQKIEDMVLIERIKRGETVNRNERQLASLQFLKDELAKLDGSDALNEFTIACGRCHRPFKVPTDRDMVARVSYFKKRMAFKTKIKVEEDQISPESDEDLNDDNHELLFDEVGMTRMENSGLIVPQYHPSSSHLMASPSDKSPKRDKSVSSDADVNIICSPINESPMPALLSRDYASQFTSDELLSNKQAHGKYNNAQLMFRLLLKEGLVHSGMWVNPPCPREVSSEQEKRFFDFVFHYAPQLQPFKPVLWKKVKKSLLNRRSRLQVANIPPSMIFRESEPLIFVKSEPADDSLEQSADFENEMMLTYSSMEASMCGDQPEYVGVPITLSRANTTRFSAEELLSNKCSRGKYTPGQLIFRELLREALLYAGLWEKPPTPEQITKEQEELLYEFIYRYAPHLEAHKAVLDKKVKKAVTNRRHRTQCVARTASYS